MAFDYDKLVDCFFTSGPEGRIAFHPWGTIFRGYWVDSGSRQATLRIATRQFYRVMRVWLPALFIIVFSLLPFVHGPVAWALPFVGAAMPYVWWMRVVARLTKGLERAPRSTWQGDFFRFARAASRLSYRRLLISVAFFTYLESYAARDLFQPTHTSAALGGDLLISFIDAYFIAILVVKVLKRIPTRTTPQKEFMNAAMKPVWIWIGCLFALSLVLAYSAAMHGG